jgi:hypothetical protein
MRILISFLIISFSWFSYGQNSFFKLYSGSGYDRGEGIVQLEDSSYAITGSSSSWGESSQAFLLKIDTAGNYLWSQSYGGPESEEGKRVLYNADLGFYIAGFSNSFGSGDFDAYLVKTDLNGNKLWEKTYGKPSNWERINDAIWTKDSTILMVGEVQATNGAASDIFIIHADKNGDTLWTKTFGSIGEDRANSIVSVQDSLFIIGGEMFIPDSNLVKGFILKMNAQGTIIWEDTVSDLAGKYGVSDLSLGLDKIYVIGFREVNPENFDDYAGTFDLDGNLIFQYTKVDLAQIASTYFNEVAFLPGQNKIAIAYQTLNQGTFQDNYDIIVANFFDDLDLYWLDQFRAINNEGLDEAGQVLATNDGTYVTVGTNASTGLFANTSNGGSHIFVMKVGANNVFPITYNVNTLNQLVEIESLGSTIQAKISPNPFNEKLTISIASEIPIQGVIYNALLEEVLQFDIFGETTIETSNLSPGAYFVKLGDRFYQKIIKVN